MLGMQFLVQLSLFLWVCLGRFSDITQSCLCFWKINRWMEDSSESTAVTLLWSFLLGQDLQALCMMQSLIYGVKIISLPWWLSARKGFGVCCSCWISPRCIFYPSPSEGKQTRTAISIWQDVSPGERKESKTCWDSIKVRTRGAAMWFLVTWRKSRYKDTSYPANPLTEYELRSWSSFLTLDYLLQLFFAAFPYISKWRTNPKSAVEQLLLCSLLSVTCCTK